MRVMAIPIGTRKRRPNLMLKELRINRGLSPNELGALVGRTGKTIRFAEHGFVPTPVVQYDIAQFFGLKPTDIWPLRGVADDRRKAAA